MPEFVGGQEAFFQYLSESIDYPQMAKEAGVEGKVYVQFVVEKDGSITDVKVIRGAQKQLDQEALRVIEEMDNWIPGSQNGKKVRVLFTIPINFKINK
jgi:protein TonB